MRSARAWCRRARAAAAPCVLVLLALPSSRVQAQLGGSLTLESDYRFRGVAMNGSRPTVRALLNLDAPAGWYAGVSATPVEPSPGDRYVQLVGYAGHVVALADRYSIELGGSAYRFSGESRYDFVEPYVGLLWRNAALRLHYAPRYFGAHVKTAYLDASAQWPQGDLLRLFGHVGVLAPLSRAQYAGEDAQRTRVDLRLGAGLARGRWDLRLSWAAVSRGGPAPAVYGGSRQGWSLAASYSF